MKNRKSLSSQSQKHILKHFEYAFDLEINCLFVKHSALYNFQMMTDRVQKIRDDKNHRPSINRMIDLRDARIDLTIDEMKLFSAQMHDAVDILGIHKQAVILTEGLDQGLLRVLLGFLSDMTIELKVFLSTDPNLKENVSNWLALPDNYQFPDFIRF